MRDRHDEITVMPTVRALASIMLGDGDRDAVLSRACEATQVVVPGAAAASVTLLDGPPRTVASSSELAVRADEMQYAAGEGPCLDAAREGRPVLVSDLAADDRWPVYGPGALDVGVGGSLSLPLEIDGVSAGALNIYATEAGALDADVVDIAFELAHYTGIVAAATDERNRARALAQQLQQAMESRAVIEQAKGVLMAQHRCSADDAFQLLVRLSQESHRKLRDIAQSVTDQIVRG